MFTFILARRIFANPRPCHQKTRMFYDCRSKSDTIFALATSLDPVKGSPLGIIRVSGTRTRDVLKLHSNLQPVNTDEYPKINGINLRPRYAKLAKIVDSKSQELIDIGMLLWFPSPGSYTGEDVCEFHLHGSQAVIKKMMTSLGCLDGLRPADPGEFTKRAVHNGKMSLIQAESLSDLISAQTDKQRQFALRGLDGSTRNKYEKWISTLVNILAHLEASIDFGEDELIGEERVFKKCLEDIASLSSELSKFVMSSRQSRNLVQKGVKVSILGKPNAGKSSLMNILCRQEKSIVSSLEGTTRDVIEHSIELDGNILTLCDTAGLVDTKIDSSTENDKESVIIQHLLIEQEGVRRALQVAAKADIIIYVVDGSQIAQNDINNLNEELSKMLDSLRLSENHSKIVHLVINKIDLNDQLRSQDFRDVLIPLEAEFGITRISISLTSCKNEINIDQLIMNLSGILTDMNLCVGTLDDDSFNFANERHLALLETTLKHLDRASALRMRNIDEIAQHVRESVDYLSRIVGTVTNEQVIDVIFKDFCIGK